jgi:hypothetical protein
MSKKKKIKIIFKIKGSTCFIDDKDIEFLKHKDKGIPTTKLHKKLGTKMVVINMIKRVNLNLNLFPN